LPTAGYIELLRLAEHIALGLDGRPHWGKAHTATAEVLAPRYPEWATFQRVRAQLDPGGVFSNDYIDRVLGPSAATEPVGIHRGRVPARGGD
jgi:FAD/FMN-containing dehydrogenase